MSDSGGSPNVVSLDVPTPENEIVAASLRLEPTQLESPPGLTSPDTTQLDELSSHNHTGYVGDTAKETFCL